MPVIITPWKAKSLGIDAQKLGEAGTPVPKFGIISNKRFGKILDAKYTLLLEDAGEKFKTASKEQQEKDVKLGQFSMACELAKSVWFLMSKRLTAGDDLYLRLDRLLGKWHPDSFSSSMSPRYSLAGDESRYSVSEKGITKNSPSQKSGRIRKHTMNDIEAWGQEFTELHQNALIEYAAAADLLKELRSLKTWGGPAKDAVSEIERMLPQAGEVEAGLDGAQKSIEFMLDRLKSAEILFHARTKELLSTCEENRQPPKGGAPDETIRLSKN